MNPSFPVPFFDVAQVALNNVVQAYQMHPGPLNAGIHALYGLVHGEAILKRQFLNVFLGQMLEDLDHYATNGSFSDLSKHQTLMMIYHDVPQVEEHHQTFLRHVKERRYPWVQPVVRRIESGVALGLQTGKEFHLCRMLQDLQRYLGVTGGVDPFISLKEDVEEQILEYYKGRLFAQQSPLQFLQHYYELGRVIFCMGRVGIQEIGLKKLKEDLLKNPKYALWMPLIVDYDALQALKEKKACLIEAQLGAQLIREKIKTLEEGLSLPRGHEPDLELEYTRLRLTLEYALEGNLLPQLEQVVLDLEWKKNQLNQRIEQVESKSVLLD